MKKELYNLIFADIDNTLLSLDYAYYATEKNIDIIDALSHYINKIKKSIESLLEDNNILVIVTSQSHAYLTNEKLSLIYNSIDKKYRYKVFLFESSAGTEIKILKSNIYNYPGLLNNSGVTIHLIIDKIESLKFMEEHFENNNMKINKIYGLGDDNRDIDLLLKIKQLGGSVGIVGYRELKEYYNTDNIDIDDLCDTIARTVYHIYQVRLINDYTRKYSEQGYNVLLKSLKQSTELQEINTKQEILKQELKNDYLNGKKSIKDLVKLYFIHNLAFNNTIDYGLDRYKKILELGDNFYEYTLDQEASLRKEDHMLKKIMKV